jgi:UDP:flavonoid glycosyltransferase YjiC (YdhE family)
MATVLLTWELGAGSGHLIELLPIATSLIRRGHRVMAAVRDLSRAADVFDGAGVRFVQAPIKLGPPRVEFRPPMTLAHILNNIGFAETRELSARCEAWRAIFEFVKPDLMLCDHSPTALLSARGRNFRRAVIGSGFLCPPDQHPLANLRFWLSADAEQLHRDEDRILQNMNAVLEGQSLAPLSHITRMYAEVDETFLVTVRELDHYPERPASTYWGAWTRASGKAPLWPGGHGPKIYGYLKSFKALPDLLEQLNQWKYPTLIYPDGIDAKTRERFTSSTLRFEDQRLDIAEVGRQCDLAILNGTHGTTMSLLMAGKPTMQIPINLEQGLVAHAVKQMGAGLAAPEAQPKPIIERIQEMLGSDHFTAAAQRFAEKYTQMDPVRQNEMLVDRIEELLAS